MRSGQGREARRAIVITEGFSGGAGRREHRREQTQPDQHRDSGQGVGACAAFKGLDREWMGNDGKTSLSLQLGCVADR